MIRFVINFLIVIIFSIPVFSDYEGYIDEKMYLDKIDRYKEEIKVMEDVKYIIYSEEAEKDMEKYESEDVLHYVEEDEYYDEEYE